MDVSLQDFDVMNNATLKAAPLLTLNAQFLANSGLLFPHPHLLSTYHNSLFPDSGWHQIGWSHFPLRVN